MTARRLLLGSLLLVCLFLATAAPARAASPNIVVILADDMGYGDVQAMNPASTIPTPNLDRLASEGMTFTDAHSPSAVCTPTRYGLVTGRYCWRSRLKQGVLNGYSSHLIDDDRVTIADMLRGAGYTTACIGKWHLGLDFVPVENGRWQFDYTKPITHGPHVLGFDYFYGIPASLDFPPYVYVENDRVVELPTVDQPAQAFPAFLRAGERQPGLVMENCLDDLTKKATDYIAEKSRGEAPFFLYFPLTAPHKPALPHPRFRGKTDLGPYADFVTQVDWTVGQVLDALDDADVADDTLLVYTSDNGSYMFRRDETPDHVEDPTVQAYNPSHHTANGPLRGTKADIYEAGHRVPFFVRWPGRVAAGSTCDQTVCHVDLYATFAEVTGREMVEDAAEDSFSLVPLLDGEPSNDRAPVIHHSGSGMFALRDGRWKLVAGNGSGGREAPKGKPFEKPFLLFDLESDLGEANDVAAEHPEIVEQMTKVLREMIDSGRTRP